MTAALFLEPFLVHKNLVEILCTSTELGLDEAMTLLARTEGAKQLGKKKTRKISTEKSWICITEKKRDSD